MLGATDPMPGDTVDSCGQALDIRCSNSEYSPRPQKVTHHPKKFRWIRCVFNYVPGHDGVKGCFFLRRELFQSRTFNVQTELLFGAAGGVRRWLDAFHVPTPLAGQIQKLTP